MKGDPAGITAFSSPDVMLRTIDKYDMKQLRVLGWAVAQAKLSQVSKPLERAELAVKFARIAAARGVDDMFERCVVHFCSDDGNYYSRGGGIAGVHYLSVWGMSDTAAQALGGKYLRALAAGMTEAGASEAHLVRDWERVAGHIEFRP